MMKSFFLVLFISTNLCHICESKPVETSSLQPQTEQKFVNTQQLVYFNGVVPAEDQGLLENMQHGAGPIFIKFNGDEEPIILDYSENPERTEVLINNTLVLGRYFYRFLRTLYRAGTFLVSFVPTP